MAPPIGFTAFKAYAAGSHSEVTLADFEESPNKGRWEAVEAAVLELAKRSLFGNLEEERANEAKRADHWAQRALRLERGIVPLVHSMGNSALREQLLAALELPELRNPIAVRLNEAALDLLQSSRELEGLG